jgi:hypothetical protein
MVGEDSSNKEDVLPDNQFLTCELKGVEADGTSFDWFLS